MGIWRSVEGMLDKKFKVVQGNSRGTWYLGEVWAGLANIGGMKQERNGKACSRQGRNNNQSLHASQAAGDMLRWHTPGLCEA